VTDPTVVKTVSKNKVSALVFKDASGLVINDSFRHEKNIKTIKKMKAIFFKLFSTDY
jgi:hypothetical protein